MGPLIVSGQSSGTNIEINDTCHKLQLSMKHPIDCETEEFAIPISLNNLNSKRQPLTRGSDLSVIPVLVTNNNIQKLDQISEYQPLKADDEAMEDLSPFFDDFANLSHNGVPQKRLTRF